MGVSIPTEAVQQVEEEAISKSVVLLFDFGCKQLIEGSQHRNIG